MHIEKMPIETICRASKTSAPVQRRANRRRSVPPSSAKNFTALLGIHALERRGGETDRHPTEEPTGTVSRCPCVPFGFKSKESSCSDEHLAFHATVAVRRTANAGGEVGHGGVADREVRVSECAHLGDVQATDLDLGGDAVPADQLADDDECDAADDDV